MEKFILICVVENDDIFIKSVHDNLEDAQTAMKDLFYEYHFINLGISDEEVHDATESEDCGIEDYYAWSAIDEHEERRWKIEKITV